MILSSLSDVYSHNLSCPYWLNPVPKYFLTEYLESHYSKLVIITVSGQFFKDTILWEIPAHWSRNIIWSSAIEENQLRHCKDRSPNLPHYCLKVSPLCCPLSWHQCFLFSSGILTRGRQPYWLQLFHFSFPGMEESIAAERCRYRVAVITHELLRKSLLSMCKL